MSSELSQKFRYPYEDPAQVDPEKQFERMERKRLRRLRSATGVAYPTGYLVFRGLIWLIGQLLIKVEVYGIENIPRGTQQNVRYRPRWYRRRGQSVIDDGSFVLAANHGSVWDIPALGIFRRPFIWICKPWFVANPLLGQINQRMGALPVFRKSIDGNTERNSPEKIALLRSVSYTPKEMFSVAHRALLRGIPAIMFPEGTRLDSASLGDAYLGAAILACKAWVPILPVALAGCAKEDTPMRTRLLRRRIIVVCIGEPIDPSSFEGEVPHEAIHPAMVSRWQRVMDEELLPKAHDLRNRHLR